MDADTRDVSVRLPADLEAAIEAQLEYGDSKSAWIREAVKQRLADVEQAQK